MTSQYKMKPIRKCGPRESLFLSGFQVDHFTLRCALINSFYKFLTSDFKQVFRQLSAD